MLAAVDVASYSQPFFCKFFASPFATAFLGWHWQAAGQVGRSGALYVSLYLEYSTHPESTVCTLWGGVGDLHVLRAADWGGGSERIVVSAYRELGISLATVALCPASVRPIRHGMHISLPA